MLSPATLSFTGLGTLPVTLTNSGTATLTITSLAASGNFTETDNCAGQSVAVQATCTINVSFVLLTGSPGGSSGTVTITDNTAAGTDSLSLSGPQVAAPGGALTPMNLTFGAQPIGTSSSPQTVTLTNPVNGLAAPLTIARVTTNGDYAIAQNACPSSLPAGANGCTISVTFTPTMSGMRPGTLNVFDNAVASSIQITQLNGTGQ
jgi:hypothetical protein